MFKRTGKQPNIVIDSVPISVAELGVINGAPSEKVYSLLESSVNRLSEIPTDLIVIPCNTVHIYFERLQKTTKTPILNIIDQTAITAKGQGIGKIGIIATTMTVASGLYKKSFQKVGIIPATPSDEDQKRITDTVIKILGGITSESDIKFLSDVAGKFADEGADGVVLGCTDLQLLVNKHDKIKVIDSMESLADATVGRIMQAYNISRNSGSSI